eukprot:scaffold6654_cov135-Skeletonema_menzelii.AAC.2
MEGQQGESSIGSGSGGGGTRSARKRWNAISGVATANARTAATDATLLLASLEQAPMEDEAEAALIEVLERRQVTFDANLPLSTPQAYRRMRTPTELPSIDNILSSSFTGKTSSPLALGRASPSRPKPPLARRAVSQGHRRRMSRGVVGLRDRLGSAELDQILAGDGGGGMDIPAAKSGESEGGVSASSSTRRPSFEGGVSASSSTRRPSLQRAKSLSGHRRVMSSLPVALDPLHQGTVVAGLSDAGERSLRVARQLHAGYDDSDSSYLGGAAVSNAIAESSGLPDLLNIMEAKREQENEFANQGGGNSRGSRGSRGSRTSLQGGSIQGGSKTGSRSGGSRNGGSLFSGGASWGRSRGESSGGRMRNRPFFGVSSPWSDGGGLSNVDALLQAAERVQELCQIPEDEEQEDVLANENAAFLSQLAASHPTIEPVDEEGLDGATNEQTPMLAHASRMRGRVQIEPESSNWLYKQPAFLKLVLWVNKFRTQMHLLAVAFDLPYVADSLWNFIQNQVTMYMVPALAVSAFLFYHLGNPSPKLFENGATLSWWILFGMRNYMTLQLAYGSEYVLTDVLALRSTVLLEIVGPLITLYIIQAKGWPLISIFWGLWSLALIQNMDGWLAWTEIEMFTAENHDGGIISGDTYLEVLTSLIIIGVATTIKRTVLALYLGKRIYFHYKRKVERVMLEMLLITEVSDLSQAIDDFEFVEEDEKATKKASTKESIAQGFKTSTMADIAKKQLGREAEPDSEEEDNNNELLTSIDDDGEDSDEEKSSQLLRSTPTWSGGPNNPTWNTLRRDKSDTSDVSAPEFPSQLAHSDEQCLEVPDGPPVQDINEPVRNLLRVTSTTAHIKSLLNGWEEPVNKRDKEIQDPTIHEILQFRKALSFLEDSHPFGLSFGPAFSRDSCIKSSKALYKGLLALTPGSTILHFDVIGVLAYNADGSFDERKAKELVKLFRPDKNDEISLLAFVQSCDSAYKKLRYLRAGVSNSTLIDKVLENFFNGVFSICLGLGVMAVLKMNPWTLLVSMSTILVSFAFAFGPSVAQIIEGCIMIAVRRPFDLGDRIGIADSSDKPQDGDPGYNATWFVEDCNLFTTTLRLSKSNEIATVKNGSIADKKIINHNRSEKALVNVELSLKSSVTHEEVTIVKSAIEQHVVDNPRDCYQNAAPAHLARSPSSVDSARRFNQVLYRNSHSAQCSL